MLDLKRDKAKVIFGVSGIAISLFLLTSIGMLNDTVNYNYMLYVTSTTGKMDIMISKSIQTDLTFNPFYDQDILDNELKDIEGVEELFPRILMLVKTTSEKMNTSGSLQLYGIEFQKEADNGNLGDLIVLDEEGEETNEIYNGEPQNGECVILGSVAEILNVSKGDTISLEYQNYNLDLIVVEICSQDQKFMQFENALILVNLNQAQIFLQREGKINLIVGTITNPKIIYDASNLRATTRALRRISTKIQNRLNINEFSITLPKLEELEGGEFLLLSITIMFWFITILSMLITAILINSILSTSVEERVREFGIIRVVGGKKIYPVKMVLFEGLMLGVIGSVIGMIFGGIFMIPIARSLFHLYNFQFGISDVEWIIKPQTIILTFTLGAVVSLVVALLPALKTAKKELIKSITPFQSKEEAWEIKKEGSMNVKSFLVGIAIATIGIIVFVLLPNIMVTGDFMLTSSLFIGLLAAVLIGLVFASIGIVPLIQKFFLGIISPAIRKYKNIIGISLKRYRRRNTSTVLMFAISFSFIFFITSTSEIQSETMALNINFQYGSDLVLINQALDNEVDALTMEMIEEIKNLPGIEKISTSLHNTFDFQATLAAAFEVNEGQVGFRGEESEELLMNLFQFYASQEKTKFKTTAGDLLDFDVVDAGFIGIDEDFINIVNRDFIIWSSEGSSTSYSFNELFMYNNTCILAKSIASILGIHDVGQYIRLTFYDPLIENDPGIVTILRVVGISGGIPGFFNFRSNELSAYGGGVMVSLDNYIRLMRVKNPEGPNMIVDKAFVNLIDNSEENVDETKSILRLMYQDKDIVVDDAITKINFIRQMSDRQSFLMELILSFTIMISIFGLVSSMYAIMLERKFEIGILRSMGMKTRNVRNMFLIESMIILLSSGIMGVIIGTFTSYFLETNMSIITEMPSIFRIPTETIIRVFSISVSIGFIGTYVILIKLSRQTIMETFRETF